jgi:hypothetical protein
LAGVGETAGAAVAVGGTGVGAAVATAGALVAVGAAGTGVLVGAGGLVGVGGTGVAVGVAPQADKATDPVTTATEARNCRLLNFFDFSIPNPPIGFWGVQRDSSRFLPRLFLSTSAMVHRTINRIRPADQYLWQFVGEV